MCVCVCVCVCKDWNLRPKPTKNSESQPNKPKTIYLLKSRSYKQTTKPRKFRLIELDTQIQQNIFLRPIRGQCVLILIKLFCSQSIFLSPPFFSILHARFYEGNFVIQCPSIHPNFPPVQFLGNPLDACLINAFLEIIGRAMNWENTVQVLFLHKYGQFSWYSTFPDISSFHC